MNQQQPYTGEFLVAAAGLTPLAAYSTDPVRGALLGFIVLTCLLAAGASLYLLRPMVPATLLLPLVLALSCACCYLATLALKLSWYPAGIALAAPLALAGGCSAVVLVISELALCTRLEEVLKRALAAGGVCLALLLGVGLLRGQGAWLAGHVQPNEWLSIDGATYTSAGWPALLILGLLLGVARAAVAWRAA